jgi:hypothetical protein
MVPIPQGVISIHLRFEIVKHRSSVLFTPEDSIYRVMESNQIGKQVDYTAFCQ